MKKVFLILFAIGTAFTAKAQSEENTAKSVIMALKHKSFYQLEFILAEPENKKAIETKFNLLLSNASKSGINVEKLAFDFQKTERIEGLNELVQVIVYKTEDGTNWDDIILLLDKKSYTIIDIGLPEKTLKKDAASRGKNMKNIAGLIKVFYPNLPIKEDALNAAKNIINIVNTGKPEDLIPFMVYTGSEDPARKHMSQPLNPKIEKDQKTAKYMFNKLRGLFSGPESIYAEGFKSNPENNTCNFRIVCSSTKNTEYMAFVLLNGKYLLY